jgi:hypothetical protein
MGIKDYNYNASGIDIGIQRAPAYVAKKKIAQDYSPKSKTDNLTRYVESNLSKNVGRNKEYR